jgi:dihydroorotase-like cyclic amidohydrolase
MPSIHIEHPKIIFQNELTTAHLLLEDGVIKRIIKGTASTRVDETIHANRLIGLPRLIHGHVHLRDMQLVHEETVQMGIQAAAARDFITANEMPSTLLPGTDAIRLVVYQNGKVACVGRILRSDN